MRKKSIVQILSITFYLGLLVYNISRKSDWVFDNIATLVSLVIIYLLSRRLKLTMAGLALLNLGFLMHNLGTFSFYSWSWWIFEYDNVVHLVGSIAAAYIICHFLVQSSTRVDENKAILILLIVAASITLGTFVELLEFAGYTFLGEGDGIFFAGAGDYGKLAGNYSDTMSDILVNCIGSFAGALLCYSTKES